ncbi:MAG: AAA family ATPase, partial [Planctomycetes bacterium]|nr:AAA family ATPase [Planctomycetota bacterium]
MTAVPPAIAVLVGPSGCGKTTVGRLVANRLGVGFVDADDLHDPAEVERMRHGEALDDARRGPWLDRVHQALAAAAGDGRGLVVACSALKRSYRERLGRDLPRVRCLELAVAPAKLRARLESRADHFFPPALLDSQLAALEPMPRHARIDAEQPPDAVAAAVVDRLERGDAGIVDGSALPVYDLGKGHPFARDRQQPLFDLLRMTGLVHDTDLLASRSLTVAELTTVHDLDYVECLIATSLPLPDPRVLARAADHGLGPGDNPIAAGQHDAAAAIAGATCAAVEAVLAGECRAAFQPAGGLHHAMPNRAAGFCLY